MGPKKLKRLTLGQNASKCIHRIHINLTATNKSHTDQGLLFSEPKSGVFSTSDYSQYHLKSFF